MPATATPLPTLSPPPALSIALRFADAITLAIIGRSMRAGMPIRPYIIDGDDSDVRTAAVALLSLGFHWAIDAGGYANPPLHNDSDDPAAINALNALHRLATWPTRHIDGQRHRVV